MPGNTRNAGTLYRLSILVKAASPARHDTRAFDLRLTRSRRKTATPNSLIAAFAPFSTRMPLPRCQPRLPAAE